MMQNGTTSERAIMFLSLLSLTLLNRFTLSFHLIMPAISDGKIYTSLLNRVMMTSNDRSAITSDMGDATVS